MAVSNKKYRELEARVVVVEDILRKLMAHYLEGDITIRGPSFGSWNRLRKYIQSAEENKA